MPVTLGVAPPSVLSTYSNVDAGPGALERPSASVTITSTGPAPSWGRARAAATCRWRGGSVSVSVSAPSTWMALGGACHAPTCTPATSAAPALEAAAFDRHVSPPAVVPAVWATGRSRPGAPLPAA